MGKQPVDEQTANVDAQDPAELFGAPVAEPEPEKKTEPEPTPEPTAEPAPAEAPEPTPEPVPTPESKRFKLWDGTEITAEELAKRPDLIEDLVQTRHQFPHIQKKYVELLEASRTPAAPATAPAAAAPATAPQGPEKIDFSVDKWKQDMAPMVEQLTKQGVITKDDLDFAPGLVTLVANLLQDYWTLKNAALDTYQHRINPALQMAERITQQAEDERVWGTLSNRLNEVQGRGEFFAGLADNEERQKFVRYLAENVNPEMEAILGDRAAEFLAAQYVGFKRDPLLGALAKASTTRAQESVAARRVTSGEAATPAGRGKKEPAGNADIMELLGRG